jgi:hypothetical protein
MFIGWAAIPTTPSCGSAKNHKLSRFVNLRKFGTRPSVAGEIPCPDGLGEKRDPMKTPLDGSMSVMAMLRQSNFDSM